VFRLADGRKVPNEKSEQSRNSYFCFSFVPPLTDKTNYGTIPLPWH